MMDMGEYYLDIETYSPNLSPDPLKDKIIAIAFQPLSTENGKPRDKLTILTEWDLGSEKSMLSTFRQRFLTGNDFTFVPIGTNLYGFDLIAILHKMNQYFGTHLDFKYFRSKPVLDLKPILVIMHGGEFRDFAAPLGKTQDGSRVKDWYDMKDYSKITTYMIKESQNFIRAYQILKKRIPKIGLKKGAT
jgi:hypothetical protein